MALMAAAVFLVVVGWVSLAGGPAEPATSGHPGVIEVTSPTGVAISEGELQKP